MGLTKYKLGELIELVQDTNSELQYGPDDVKGMTITKPANKKSSVFLKKISKIRFDILCITFKPPEMPALKVVI